MNYTTPQNIFDALVAIGVIAYAIGQFKWGRKSRSKDDLDTENSAMELQAKQIRVLEDALKEQQTINIETGKKLAALEAVNAEKDKTIKEQMITIQNRNPNLEKVLGDILDFMKKINIHMEKDLQITGTVSVNK